MGIIKRAIFYMLFGIMSSVYIIEVLLVFVIKFTLESIGALLSIAASSVDEQLADKCIKKLNKHSNY